MPGAGRGTNDGLRVTFSDGRSHLEYSVLLQTALNAFSVTHNQFLLMASLYEHPGHRASPSELSLDVGRTRSNVTLICDQLVECGWVDRRHGHGDRRRVEIVLTPAGMQRIDEVLARLSASIASRVDSSAAEEP